MKQSNDVPILCSSCQTEFLPGQTHCNLCGSPVLKEKSVNEKPAKTSLTVLSTIFLTLFSLIFVLLYFTYEMASKMPSVLELDLEDMGLFNILSSVAPTILCAVLVAGLLAAVICLNLHRARRIFLSLGTSALVLSALCLLLYFFADLILMLFSGGLLSFFSSVSAAFLSFSLLCCLILLLVGTTCLSVYYCLKAIKGDSYEK